MAQIFLGQWFFSDIILMWQYLYVIIAVKSTTCCYMWFFSLSVLLMVMCTTWNSGKMHCYLLVSKRIQYHVTGVFPSPNSDITNKLHVSTVITLRHEHKIYNISFVISASVCCTCVIYGSHTLVTVVSLHPQNSGGRVVVRVPVTWCIKHISYIH